MADLKEFQKRLAEDPQFLAKMREKTVPDELIAAAKKEGYSLTVEEVAEIFSVDTEDLSSVAGGFPGVTLSGLDIESPAHTPDGFSGFKKP